MSGALVLVTGASGFIAGHCVKELAAAGYRVRGTVRSTSDEKLVGHLKALDPNIELVQADLLKDAGWAEAAKGCTYVLHVASPFVLEGATEATLIPPAVDGTKRVLQAAADAGVKRVVLTSSVAAVSSGREETQDYVFSERDWSDPDRAEPYAKSKTLAESAAWALQRSLPEAKRFELCTINPSYVQGPFTSARDCTSNALTLRMLKGDLPAIPKLGLAIVDVRDVALAHVRAMTAPQASGQRYILSSDTVWMTEVADMMQKKYSPLGYRIHTLEAPWLVLWLASFFDRQMRAVLPGVGKKQLYNNSKAKKDLGIEFRSVEEAVLGAADSLIEHGLVSKKGLPLILHHISSVANSAVAAVSPAK